VTVYHTRIQWNVGQGGFHSGELRDGERRFRYVYDCGSASNGHPGPEVAEYIKSLGADRYVDAVVLSHIDSDHVNGLEMLLRDCEVGRVFLPLLSPIERLSAFLRAQGGVSPFFESMAVSPVTTIADRSSETIVTEVRRGAAPAPAGDDGLSHPFSPQTSERDSSFTVEIVEYERSLVEVNRAHQNIADSACVRVRGEQTGPLWALSFHVSSKVTALSRRFRHELERAFPISVHPEESALDEATLRAMLTNRDQLKILRQVYAEAGVNVNASSMSMIAGPVLPSSGGSETVQFGRYGTTVASPSWLLTGDAVLKSEPSVRELCEHFVHQITSVGVIALPHHGSRRNFHRSLLSATGGSTQFVFACAGISHEHWLHPHPAVMMQVANEGMIPWVVSESEETRIFAYSLLSA
jgi:hypothetical protein